MGFRKPPAYAKLFGMNNPTPTALLIQERLGAPLATYVAERRNQGQSWNAVARALYDDTGIAVTSETLRNWYGTNAAA